MSASAFILKLVTATNAFVGLFASSFSVLFNTVLETNWALFYVAYVI